MALSREMTPKEHENVKKALSVRGRITDCENKTSIHRTTISRIMRLGVGETENVESILNYSKIVNKKKPTAA